MVVDSLQLGRVTLRRCFPRSKKNREINGAAVENSRCWCRARKCWKGGASRNHSASARVRKAAPLKSDSRSRDGSRQGRSNSGSRAQVRVSPGNGRIVEKGATAPCRMQATSRSTSHVRQKPLVLSQALRHA